MPTVTITTPSGAPQRVVISPNRKTTTFGRSSKCDIRISCESVSARHATLRHMPDGYVLRDMGSTNGTKLKGERVTEIWMGKDQDIQLGDVTFQFEPDPKDHEGKAKTPTQTLDAEGAPSAKVNVKGSTQPNTAHDSLVMGLAAVGAGLIAVGVFVLLGLEAFLAIAERGKEFILGGCGLILIGLLCLASILLVTGRVRIPKLVVRLDRDEKDTSTRSKRSRRKQKQDESDEEAEDASDDEPQDKHDDSEQEDSDEDTELGKAPKE